MESDSLAKATAFLLVGFLLLIPPTRAIALPLFSLQVPLNFDLNPTLSSPPPLPRSNVIIEDSTSFALGSFASDGSVVGGDAALVIFIQNPSPLIESVAVHADPSIRIDASNPSARGTILTGARGGNTKAPHDFNLGFFEFDIDFVSAAIVGDVGSFDIGLALVDQLDQPLSSAPGVSYEMDVQLGNTNTDQGTRFPQARIGGASGFVIPVPEPGTLSLIGLAFAGVGWARRRKPNWQQATEKKKTKMKLDS